MNVNIFHFLNPSRALRERAQTSSLNIIKGIFLSVCVERETCVVPKRFEPEYLPLKYNPTSSEYKIHSVEVDLYYFKYL